MTTLLQSNPPALDGAGNAHSEFRTLVSACGIYALSAKAKISVSGKDRVRWLNGMVSNNIRDLAAGHGVYAFLLNPQGHILGDLYAYSRSDSLLLDIGGQQSENILAILRRYIIMDKVELEDISGRLTAWGVAGPKAEVVLRAAGFEFPDLGALQSADLMWSDIPITVMRGDNQATLSFELWIAPEHTDVLRRTITESGRHGSGLAGGRTVAHRIRHSQLKWS